MRYSELSAEQKRKAKERLRKWRANLSGEKKEKYNEKNRIRSHKYYIENSEKAKQKSRERYRENPDKAKERTKRYKKEHSLEIKKNIEEWHKEHPERVREIKKKWDKGHPGSRLERRHRRRVRERKSSESFTSYEFRLLCNAYGNICLKCGQDKPLTPDHVVPIALGGSNSIDNIQPLCLDCNMKKGTKIVDYRNRTPIHVEQLSFDSIGL